MAKTYTPVGWEDGTILKQPTVTINNVEYEITPAEVEGTTPVVAENLRHMDDAIKELYDEGTTSKDIVIGTEEDTTEDTKLLIEKDTIETLGTEVVNSLDGNESYMAPSVQAVNKILNGNKSMGSIVVEDVTCKNLINPRLCRLITTGGLTVSVNDDGQLVLNGTTTAEVDIYCVQASNGYNVNASNYINKKLGTYTLSNNLGFTNYFRTTSAYQQNTVTITETDLLDRVFLRVPSGRTFNNTILEVQLEKGSLPTNYSKHINIGYGIVDSGSNDNGNYVKFADGTMICSNTINLGIQTWATYGALYNYEAPSVDYPKEFIDVPFLTISPKMTTSNYCFFMYAGSVHTTNKSTGLSNFIRHSTNNVDSVQYTYLAIGRWK